MDQEHGEVSYDEVYQKPRNERLRIFREISAENRAALVRTHAERWLAGNRARLSAEQIAVLEEVMQSISPRWYEPDRDVEAIEAEADVLTEKLETVLSRKDCRQFATTCADHIPEG